MYDFAAAGGADFDFSSASPDLLLSGVGLDGNEDNWLADSSLLDPSIDLSGGGVMIPDMATQTPPLGVSGDLGLSLEAEFFSQETHNLLHTSLEQPTLTTSVDTLLPPSNTPTTTSTPAKNSPSYAPNSSAFSTFAVTIANQSSPSDSSSSSGSKRKASSPEDELVVRDLKRQRNTMAARKYRQKRLDRIAELEKALADITGDRDDLRLKLARKEAEVDALREMLGSKK